jgi:hypothetical protein
MLITGSHSGQGFALRVAEIRLNFLLGQLVPADRPGHHVTTSAGRGAVGQGRLLPDEGVGGAGGVVAAADAARVDPLH